MTNFQPESFSFLYANDKAPGQSLDEKIDLKSCDGHIMRDSNTKKFLYFPDIMKLTEYFTAQEKPYLHSVINRYRPVRFNLELDMPVESLDNVVFTKDNIKKIKEGGYSLDFIKSIKILEHIQDTVGDILEEEYGIEVSDYKFMTASDNRKEKYSYRFYLKLMFANMREYKHFISLLSVRVRPEVLSMIDPTSLMLRTPGSFKDNHQAKWTAPTSIEESILSHTANCDSLDEIAPDEESEQTFDELTSKNIKDAVSVLSVHKSVMGNYACTGESKGFINLKRIQPSHCDICDRVHDISDAYATIDRGNVYLRCFRDTEKRSIFIGFIGEAEAIKFRWGDVRRAIQAQKKLSDSVMSTKEKTAIGRENKTLFDVVKKEAWDNSDTLKAVCKFVFTDFIKFHGKTLANDEQVERYIRQTISKIVMGGNSLYITSDVWKGSKHFTELSSPPCSHGDDAYSYKTINKDFNPEQAIDDKKNPMVLTNKLKDTINRITMMEFYKAVDFVPYLVKPVEVNREIFNMFEGFKYPYISGQTDIKPSVVPWVNHILNIICSGDEALAKIMTQWMAHIVQCPAEKSFAVILYGRQGTGKSILYEFFTRCIGKDLGLQVGKLEDLTQTHNTHVRGKLIVNCNEATNEPAIRDVNILKGLITETDLIINPKGVNQYTVSNFSRLMITSNYSACMRLDKDDRRYMCLEISDSKKNNDEYFAPLIDGLKNEKTQADFFNYLANYDISDFKHQRPPLTKMKREMIGNSVSNIVSYVLDVCDNSVINVEYEEEKDEILPSSKDFYDDYVAWCQRNDAKGRRCNKKKFIGEMKFLFNIVEVMPRIDGSRKRRFKINRVDLLPKFKEHFCSDEFAYKVA